MTYYYGCGTELESSKVSRVEVVPWSDENTIMRILEELLKRWSRTLTVIQWNYVREQVRLETLSYEQVRVEPLSYEHCEGFNSVESRYGVVFTRAAFSCSTHGLADKELMDLPTLHKDVISKDEDE